MGSILKAEHSAACERKVLGGGAPPAGLPPVLSVLSAEHHGKGSGSEGSRTDQSWN